MVYVKSDADDGDNVQDSPPTLRGWRVHSTSFIDDIWSHTINPLSGETEEQITGKRKAVGNWRGHSEIKWTLIIFSLTAITIWAMAFALFGNLAFPGGSLFALLVLQLVTTLFGQAAERLYLPPAFGMILGGILLKNIPQLKSIGMDLDTNVTNQLRAISIVVLLTRGALAVNLHHIIKNKTRIPPLYIGSCAAEACAAAIAAYFLIGFPIPWCAAMGCIYSAMSGGIVTPYLLAIERKVFRGERNVTMTLAKEACGLDAILAISMTQVAFGFIFASHDDISSGLQTGAVEVAYGFVFGITWGIVAGLGFKHEQNDFLKTFVILAGGTVSLLGLTRTGYPRGGQVGCFFGSLVTGGIWSHKKEQVTLNFNILFNFFRPLLFGIMGSRVDLLTVNWNTIAAAGLCLIISLLVRMCATFLLLTLAGGMTTRQKLFIVIVWLPKGTVQATLGPVALETAMRMGVDLGSLPYDLLTISVLVILFGTLLGPFCILAFGTKLLKTDDTNTIVCITNPAQFLK